MDNLKNSKTIVILSFFIALDIILTRFLSYQDPNGLYRIGFNYVSTALCSSIFGMVIGGITAGLGDILGMIVFPKGFAYFPGFTLSAILKSVIFGFFLHNKPKTKSRIYIASIINTFFVDVCLNTLWVSILYGKGFWVSLLVRLPFVPIQFAVQVLILTYVFKYLEKVIDKLDISPRKSEIGNS